MRKYAGHICGAAFVLVIMFVWGVIAMACKPSSSDLAGGYTHYRQLTDNDRLIFECTYHDHLSLTPKRVATQVVAGTNYRFLCEDNQGNAYEVVIFVPLPCYLDTQDTIVTSVQAQ